MLKAMKIKHEREFQFNPNRKWKADFRIDDVLVEVDGGNRMAVRTKTGAVAIGRHSQDKDYEKLASAAILGWRVIRVTPRQVKSGQALDWILEAIKRKEK